MNNFGQSRLNGLSGYFNNLKSELNGLFITSQNTLKIASDRVFNAAQRFPYYSLTNETRDALSSNITNFLTNCSRTTTDYLGYNATLLMFDFSTNNTSPIESAFKPVRDILSQSIEAIQAVSDSECLRRVGLGFGRFERNFNTVLNYINQCTRALSLNYRPAVREYNLLYFEALQAINKLASDLRSCGSSPSSEREFCAKNIVESISGPNNPLCSSL